MEDHIEYETRALTETRYAQIEKKMLAIVFHMERFNQCTFSRHVSVHSDRHKPLETILQKLFSQEPPGLQTMMIRLQKYDVEIRYERGKPTCYQDPVLPYESKGEAEIECVNMLRYLPIYNKRLEEIRRQVSEEPARSYQLSERRDTPEETHSYFNMRDELTIQDGLIFQKEFSRHSWESTTRHEGEDPLVTYGN